MIPGGDGKDLFELREPRMRGDDPDDGLTILDHCL